MKNKILTIASLFVLGLGTSYAQEIAQNQVPDVIQTSFQQKFPKASDIEWEKEGNLYKVEFEIGWSQDYDAWYDARGNLVKYKAEVAEKDLPAAITNAIKSNYPVYKIDDADMYVENGKTVYKIEIEKADEKRDIYLDKNGKTVKGLLNFNTIK
ncbi:hypothetical protein GO491_06485 [Flavobacteriaceae bacterium Ap0902]|nr:hypothetical protein [Flavobacteriaceae bacterium Ap0902]